MGEERRGDQLFIWEEAPLSPPLAAVLHAGTALEGSAQRLLEHTGDGEELLSWCRLVAKYELATAGRETSLMLDVFSLAR